MSIHQIYAVFGLGRFGMSVAKELVRSGADVLAVDKNEAVVNAAVAEIPHCKCADITDAEALEKLDISGVDVVVISMAKNLEAAVMATMLCKEAGVGTVIVKCANEMHRKIMEKVGADQVVIPESESGVRMAKNLLSAGFVDMVELSKDVSLLEFDLRPEWVGKNLMELNLRKKYAINVVAIRQGDAISTEIDPALPLQEDMQLIIIADTAKLKKIK
jgi:trk system potassium uptake protein TrkA